jgi:hypothetical protein
VLAPAYAQVYDLIGLLRKEAEERSVRGPRNMRSPALLDALRGELHRSVVVCFRDHEGQSRLCRLPDLDSYLDVVTAGSLGDAAVADALRLGTPPRQTPRRP